MDTLLDYATELHDVVDFEIIDDFILRLQFDDGFTRTIDFEPILIGPVWGKLKDSSLFHQVRLDREIGTLVWPGDIDIDPTVLHDWPDHVNYIIERHRRLFIAAAGA